MTAAAPSAVRAAAAMVMAARHFLELLDDTQQQSAVPGFPGEPERSRWFYTWLLAEYDNTERDGNHTPPLVARPGRVRRP